MLKTWSNNDMIDHIGLVYTKIEIELSRLIRAQSGILIKNIYKSYDLIIA